VEEEELGVAGGYEAGDVVVEEFVDAFEVPGTQFGCLVLVYSRFTSSGRGRLGERCWGRDVGGEMLGGGRVCSHLT
jgi:hypothetical protein